MRQVSVSALLERLGIKGQLKGRDWWACCPSPGHDERTASWRMRDEPEHDKHGLHVCYGCGFGGGPVSLVRAVLGFDDSKKAWAWIESGAAGLEAAPNLRLAVDVRPTKRRRFELPPGVTFAPLDKWVGPPRRYAESRGLTAEQVERWGIGYSVAGWLSGRIVIPVRDGAGRVLSYTGRTFTGASRKYREPREEEGADKAAVFGAQHWPDRAERRVVVVAEGALDALAIERSTGLPVAAIFGSEFLPAHAGQLESFGEIVVATDPDRAGEKVAAEIRFALGRWRKVRRVHMPDGYDACDLERDHGRQSLAELLAVPAAA